jgi:hypothetical protein
MLSEKQKARAVAIGDETMAAMSIRTWLAGQALSGLATMLVGDKAVVAAHALAMADAMLIQMATSADSRYLDDRYVDKPATPAPAVPMQCSICGLLDGECEHHPASLREVY